MNNSPEKTSLQNAPLNGSRLWAVVAFVGLCLLGGSYLRFHNIGSLPYWIDELFHVFAAQSYLKDGSLTVPFHGEYTRAFPITRITAWSFSHFGINEVSARAPFAAFNLLFLVISFFFVKRIFGLLPALATLCVLSFAPFMIQMSRECRMYTVFQLLYFSWLATFLLGVEPDGERPGWEGHWGVDIRWLAASVAIFPMSVVIHELTWTGGIVVGFYLSAMFVWECVRRGLRAAIVTKYGVSMALMVLGTVAVLVFAHGRVADELKESREIPPWMLAPDGKNFYRHLLTYVYPVFALIYPLAAIKFVKDHGRRGFFAVSCFLVLFLFHSYVFGRKDDRYIFYIFPFFVLVSSSLFADALFVLAAKTGRSRVIAGAGAALVVCLFFYRWLPLGLHGSDIHKGNTWENRAAEVRRIVGNSTVIETDPLVFLNYQRRAPDYFFLGEVWKGMENQKGLIRTFDQFKAVLDQPGVTVFVTDVRSMGNPAYVTPEMETLIKARMRVEHSEYDRRVLYYEELPSKS